MLADNLTVWENIVLGDEPGTACGSTSTRRREAHPRARPQYGLDVDPDELVADLGVGEKQRVEILKVLYRGARIIILDEPTAVLVPQEVDELFASLRELTAQGVDHHLHLPQARRGAGGRRRHHRHPRRAHGRRGRRPATVTARELAELMVGSELPDARDRGVRRSPTSVALRRRRTLTVGDDASGRTSLDDVSFTVHAGEIVGIAGVEGNGQTELIEAIMGIRASPAGTIALDGQRPHPRRAPGAPRARHRLHPRGPPARRAAC